MGEEVAEYKDLWPKLVLRQVKTDANQKYVGKTLAEIAKERGVTPVEAMIDLSVEDTKLFDTNAGSAWTMR